MCLQWEWRGGHDFEEGSRALEERLSQGIEAEKEDRQLKAFLFEQ